MLTVGPQLMEHLPLIIPLVVRSLSLLLPQTFFQPDEFYQTLEPAHHYIFGYGFLSWEWRDLPKLNTGSWWDEVVVGGRMRGWIWPGVFAGLYKLLNIIRIDTYSLPVGPRQAIQSL
jgi:phosphatidylinositol glycan class B